MIITFEQGKARNNPTQFCVTFYPITIQNNSGIQDKLHLHVDYSFLQDSAGGVSNVGISEFYNYQNTIFDIAEEKIRNGTITNKSVIVGASDIQH